MLVVVVVLVLAVTAVVALAVALRGPITALQILAGAAVLHGTLQILVLMVALVS